ncbi:heterotrimeric G protein alpha subunit [Skeletonema marinoi]|uniref:Heterotrimeric G protein alpha subunit n=1 Tax=Skeletonema marinoi TaxID=267567 RepID=A0AAD9DDD5_9STRA|nr:heterotrimeric G protein alpha subunit [Skeletonema marinoi]
MGCCCGASSPDEVATPSPSVGASVESRTIDNQLKRMRHEEEGKIKMLLLGAGESGKSTILKQMRLLYGTELSDDDLRMYGVVVRSNIVVATRKLCGHLRNLGLEEELDRESRKDLEDGDHRAMTCRQAYDELMAYLVEFTVPPKEMGASNVEGGGTDWVGQSPRAGMSANNDAKHFLAHHESIRILCQSKTMKQVWAKRAAVNVVDSHKEFLNDIPRIASPDYKPTTQDVLIARVRTTQVVKERYRIDGIDFEMYDVGGQRSQRRKWIDCFDQVTAVIFVVALSEYDQTLAEDKRINRMVEALTLFRHVSNHRAFENSSIVLLMNKMDIFREKIMYSDIAAQREFSDYAGPTKDFNHGVAYFVQKFKNCLVDELDDSFIHVTCATDTNNMEVVLDSARAIIMTDNLKRRRDSLKYTNRGTLKKSQRDLAAQAS